MSLLEKIFGKKKLHEIYVFHLENEEGHWYSEYCKNCEEYDGEYSNPEELYVGHYIHGKWKTISNHWKQKFGEYSPEEWIKMSKKDKAKLEITIRQEIGGTGNLIRPGSKRSLVLASGRSVESAGTVTNQIDSESHSITIIDNSSNKTAFDEVVKMFCDEILKKLGIKIISPKVFIFESQFKDNKVTKFIFPIPTKLSEEEKLLFDIVKKNVQLKIKGIKKYEGINLIGVKKMFINSSEIVNLWNIIKNDEHLCNFDGALFLNLQILFYTCEFDYDRFTDFAKQLDEYLNITKVDSKLDYNYLTKADYVDIKKRIIDAVDEVSGKIHNNLSGISKNQFQDVVKDMGKQGAIKLIYMRNYTWDIEDIKEPADLLKKFSGLMIFMQSTLKSEGEYKDFLIPTFELSTVVDFVSAYGCFATINDKTGLDDSIYRIAIPNRMKELS
ncbi:MAG: hypothetical protein Q8M95_13660 [Candidatus Methanoperedens sp.]|nr:hypothetical protein [Candidatus Methanoperedens sp.]